MAFKIVVMVVVFLLTFAGCAQTPVYEILQKPTYEWSVEDCRLLIANSTSHNFTSDSRVLAMATPFTPVVVTALGREQQKKNKLTEVQYQSTMDELMYFTLGMFVDWHRGQYVDKRGNYYKNESQQLDSLLFLLRLKNKTWPCIPPIVSDVVPNPNRTSADGNIGVMRPLLSLADWPCYTPDISDLDNRIILRNDKNVEMKPRFVWGRKNSTLGNEETLFVMFPLRSDSSCFLEDVQELYLEIRGFESTIRLKFDISLLQ